MHLFMARAFSLLLLVGCLGQGGRFAEAQSLSSFNLPLVFIETDGDSIPDDPKITARMKVVFRGEGQLTLLDDINNPLYVQYDGFIGIETRGVGSQAWPKKQYAVETRDAEGDNLNISLLGLPKENDWILYAPYHDKSLMRNVLVYMWARRLGWYAPRTVYVEVLLNGDYEGLYVLTEKIKQDKARVDIAELEESDVTGDALTGGYIVKVDRELTTGPPFSGWISPFRGNARQTIQYDYHDPKEKDLTSEQQLYIRNYITSFEHLMKEGDYADPVVGYRAYIDVPSFVDFILLSELSKNSDAYRRSSYFYKDRDSRGGKLVAGPVWDFNFSLANANSYGTATTGWNVDRALSFVPFWWPLLFYEPAFAQQLSDRWRMLRQSTFSLDSLYQDIDRVIAELGEAKDRNFERWDVLGQSLDPPRDGDTLRTTYEGEILWMKDWLRDRVAWMDDNMPANASTEIEANVEDVSERLILTSNYPNPFHDETTIAFSLSDVTHTRVVIYDVLGREVAVLVDSVLRPGDHRFIWDTNAATHGSLPSGIYFYTISTPEGQATQKMIRVHHARE